MNLESIASIRNAKSFCLSNFFDSSPFINYDFFKLLEDTECTSKLSGWIPEHFILKEGKEIVGFIPNFKKLNSMGEYIFDHMFEHAYYQLGSNYFPKFLSGIPFTPVTKLKFLYSNKELNTEKIIKLLILFVKESKVSSFHANFLNFETSKKLETHNLIQRVGIQYHWKNRSFRDFQCFLDSMKSRKKKSIQKERKSFKDQNIKFVNKKGSLINEKDMVNLYKCYLNTIDRKWSRPYLNLEFFKGLIKTSILDKMLLVTAYRNKDFLGCSIHFVGSDTLYGRYWGCMEKIPYLHFELCYYQAIEYAIKNNLSRIEAGAQGEHKISRGYLPKLTFSNHWFDDERLQAPIRKFISKENQKIKDTAEYLNAYSPFSEDSN